VLAIGLFAFDRFMPVGAGLAREHGAQDAASDNRAQGALLQEDNASARREETGCGTAWSKGWLWDVSAETSSGTFFCSMNR